MTAPLPLSEFCAAAGIRLRRPASDPTFDAILPVIRGLLAMRKAGWLDAVVVNDSKLWLQFGGDKRRHPISWHQAEGLVKQYRERMQ